MKDAAKTLKDNAKELGDLLGKGSKNDKKGPDSPLSPPKVSGGTGRNSSTSSSIRASDADNNNSATKAALLEAAERQIEKLLPDNDIDLPPTIPTPTATQSKVATSPKAAANSASGSVAPKKLIWPAKPKANALIKIKPELTQSKPGEK